MQEKQTAIEPEVLDENGHILQANRPPACTIRMIMHVLWEIPVVYLVDLLRFSLDL